MPQFSLAIIANKLVLGLEQFRLGIQQKGELLQTIGAGQLVSIRRTFQESGSPSGSWKPLSATTLSWGGKKYTAGHKLLILSGVMLNSIQPTVSGNTVTLGTNLARARVHQLGFSGSQQVAPYSYSRSASTRDKFQKSTITNKAGRSQSVKRKVSSGVSFVQVKGFSRRLNIPARPFLVFRPEDAGRIESEVISFYKSVAKGAGLAVRGGTA